MPARNRILTNTELQITLVIMQSLIPEEASSQLAAIVAVQSQTSHTMFPVAFVSLLDVQDAITPSVPHMNARGFTRQLLELSSEVGPPLLGPHIVDVPSLTRPLVRLLA